MSTSWGLTPSPSTVHHPPSGSSGMIKKMFSIVNFLIYYLLKSAEFALNHWVKFVLVDELDVFIITWGVHVCVVDCVPVSWSWLRIPGVLQRLGFTYFVLSVLQTFWGQKEIPLRAVSSSVKFTLVCHYTPGEKKKTLKKSNLKTHFANLLHALWIPGPF